MSSLSKIARAIHDSCTRGRVSRERKPPEKATPEKIEESLGRADENVCCDTVDVITGATKMLIFEIDDPREKSDAPMQLWHLLNALYKTTPVMCWRIEARENDEWELLRDGHYFRVLVHFAQPTSAITARNLGRLIEANVVFRFDHAVMMPEQDELQALFSPAILIDGFKKFRPLDPETLGKIPRGDYDAWWKRCWEPLVPLTDNMINEISWAPARN